jgi:hypothetical protein
MEFNLTYYTRRWGHDESMTFTKTKKGWHIPKKNLSVQENCDKTGSPCFFEQLEHDGVQYPHAIGMFFEWLWDEHDAGSLSEQQVQEGFDGISKWLKLVEEQAPSSGVFSGLC